MTTDVFAVAACRTPIARVKGGLASERPDHLTAAVIAALIDRNPTLSRDRIDDVYWGAANQAGEDNRNVARMGVLLGGLPTSVPGATVNRLCGSGMEAVTAAARAIACGEADICLAGGTESMTRAPFVMPRPEAPYPREMTVVDTRLGWRLVSPRMKALYPPISLGETAENVAARYGVSRAAQDEWALRSHQLASAAQRESRFNDEIVPVATPASEFRADELIRADLTVGELAARPPAFVTGGSVTAGNSSPLSDSAAGLLLMSGQAVRATGVTPLARYVGTATAGVHPDYMGMGPSPALSKLSARTGRRLGDVDMFELNEAFASQVVAVVQDLGIDPERANVNGGAIALGHPIAGSGARITVTGLHQLRRSGSRMLAVAMCVGVGQGIATLWETA
jgi:acetyl-CoA acetyltransferase family protein